MQPAAAQVAFDPLAARLENLHTAYDANGNMTDDVYPPDVWRGWLHYGRLRPVRLARRRLAGHRAYNGGRRCVVGRVP